MSDRYVVLAKRPSEYGPDGFDYQPAGSVWPSREPVENHQSYCQAEAEADRQFAPLLDTSGWGEPPTGEQRAEALDSVGRALHAARARRSVSAWSAATIQLPPTHSTLGWASQSGAVASVSARTHTSLLIAPVKLEMAPESARTASRPRPPGMTAKPLMVFSMSWGTPSAASPTTAAPAPSQTV
mgnify:CR=1 FL=1